MTKTGRIFYISLTLAILTALVSTADAQPRLSKEEVDILRAQIIQSPDNSHKLELIDKMAENAINIDTMLAYSIKESELAKNLKDTAYITKAMEREGWCLSMLGEYEKSIEVFNRVIELNHLIHDEVMYGRCFNGIGEAALGLGDFERGIEMKEIALNIFKEFQQYEQIAAIYRTIGKSCIDYMQFPMASENFAKAMEIDTSYTLENGQPNIKYIGRDYHFMARAILAENHRINPTYLNEAKDLLLKALNHHRVSNDIIYEIHSCMHLSLTYSYLSIASKKWNFADSSMYYYNQGLKAIEQSGYQRYSKNYDILRAIQYTTVGQYEEAKATLDKIDESSLEPDARISLFKGYNFIYYFTQDWKGILENMERIERNRKGNYIVEFYTKVSQLSLIHQYEGILYHLNMDQAHRTMEFNKEQQIHKSITAYATVVIFLILATIILLLIIYVYNRKINIRLLYQDAKLRAANEELTSLYNETARQSEEIAAQTREMKRQRNKLFAYNFKLMVHLGIGQRIQSYILPSIDTVRNILGDMFVMWRPLEDVSGDFYWCTECKGRKIVAVADCTGHGIPGAFLSMLGVALLNSIVPRMDNSANAAHILDNLRERVEELMGRGASNNNDIHDGMDIALCIIDSEKGKLQFAGAYRPLWMMRDGSLTEWKGNKLPIAIDNDRKGKFTNIEVDIKKGDTFYMFSDGITDQYGTLNGKPYKLKAKRLRVAVEKNFLLPMETQKSNLESAIDSWRGIHEQTDDMLMIGFRIN